MTMNAMRWGLSLAVAGTLLGAAPVQAQYPGKAVRLIVPYPPGGGTDTLARVLSLRLAEALGQQLVVDNRPGAGANIGVEIAAKAPNDGYTLLMAAISNAISASLYRKLNYDLVRDFAPITLLATTPHILVVHPSLPVKSVKGLIAFAKARPGQLAYSSSGSGTPSHLGGELFDSMAGVKLTHVPYKGGGPSVIALVGGEVSVGFATMPSVISHVRAGKLRGLAVTTTQRSPAMPDLSTVSEAGVPGYEMGSWYGLLAPAGTPKEIVVRLNAEMARILKLPDVKQRLDALGFEVLLSTPEEYGVFTKNEIEKWAKVVKASGARAD
jgi:tripartite-type tricarboxylate transporter receptor subunit TctC